MITVNTFSEAAQLIEQHVQQINEGGKNKVLVSLAYAADTAAWKAWFMPIGEGDDDSADPTLYMWPRFKEGFMTPVRVPIPVGDTAAEDLTQILGPWLAENALSNPNLAVEDKPMTRSFSLAEYDLQAKTSKVLDVPLTKIKPIVNAANCQFFGSPASRHRVGGLEQAREELVAEMQQALKPELQALVTIV